MSNLPRSLVNYSLSYLPTDVLTEHIRDRFTCENRPHHTMLAGRAYTWACMPHRVTHLDFTAVELLAGGRSHDDAPRAGRKPAPLQLPSVTPLLLRNHSTSSFSSIHRHGRHRHERGAVHRPAGQPHHPPPCECVRAATRTGTVLLNRSAPTPRAPCRQSSSARASSCRTTRRSLSRRRESEIARA